MRDNLAAVTRQLPGWTTDDLLTVAVAAYNAGAGRVIEAVRRGGVKAADSVTAHNNYASDVLKRAADFRIAKIFA